MAIKAAKKTAPTSQKRAIKRKPDTTLANAKEPASTARRSTPAAEPLTHRLDALLHTMRCIAQHEDQLCSLLHDARRSGRISATIRRELQAILAELPAEEYTDDLHAVLEVTSAA